MPVEPIGMTRNGKKVFFTTSERLVPQDTDNSVDLYMWEEDGSAGGKLTDLSQGNGQGNSDECSDSWGPSGCGVAPLTPEQAHANENLAVSAPGMDDLFGEDSGDIYFYSPENLDPGHPGVKNERNLYRVPKWGAASGRHPRPGHPGHAHADLTGRLARGDPDLVAADIV